MNDRIPTEADWRSEPWGIDTPGAYARFFGKSREGAMALLAENSLYYQEDIMFMPELCFRYYIHAYIDYLMSEKSADDGDGANCFLGLVNFRHSEINRADEYLRRRVRDALTRLAGNQSFYGAEPEIYGDFGERAAACLTSLESEA